jgi:hypothetical protein
VGCRPDGVEQRHARISCVKMIKRRRDVFGVLDYLFGLVVLLILGSLVPKEPTVDVPYPEATRAATFDMFARR